MIEINDGNLIFPDYKGKTYNEVGTPCMFLTGSAGSGKSYQLLQQVAQNPKFIYLTSTTGISAMNIGAITVHSALKIGIDPEQAYIKGTMRRPLRELKDRGYLWFGLDEVSMAHKDLLYYVYTAIDECNSEEPDQQPLGLMVTGDMAQLAPIPKELKGADGRPIKKGRGFAKEPTPWVFTSDIWGKFEEQTYKLTKIWRQSNQTFLDALNCARRGQGQSAVGLLKRAGVKFSKQLDNEFDGTTLIAKNDEVDRYNSVRLRKLPGDVRVSESKRWWARDYNSPGEWKNIPEKLELKLNAYVMILTNSIKDSGGFTYVNGDCGWVREINLHPDTGLVTTVGIELVRKPQSEEQKQAQVGRLADPLGYWEDDGLVRIGQITRSIKGHAPDRAEKFNLLKIFVPDRGINLDGFLDLPDGEQDRVADELLEEYYWKRDPETGDDQWNGDWVMGQITYLPLRLAWASTVHKSQGLTLDNVQIDTTAWFFGQPGLAYVALSRCRTPEGITLVGLDGDIARKIKSDEAVGKYL